MRYLKQSVLCLLFIANSFAAELDINHTPFSNYGSYMSVLFKENVVTKQKGLYIQDISGRYLWHWKGVFLIETLFDGEAIDYKANATHEKISLITAKGDIEITFQNANIIRFKGSGISLRLTQTVKDGASNGFPISEDGNLWRCQMGGYDHFVFNAMKGILVGDAVQTVTMQKLPDRPIIILTLNPDDNGEIEAALEQYQDGFVNNEYDIAFEKCILNRNGLGT